MVHLGMNITVLLTNQCNLNCKYCYEGKKKNERINYSILDDMLEYIYLKPDEVFNINFYGGEPTLEIDKIKYIVDKLNYKKNTYYTMTTNALNLNDDEIEWISSNIQNLSVSIDGKRETHDTNRVNIKGEGSFDKVILSAQKFLDFNKNTKARLTVTHDTAEKLYENVVYLVEMGFEKILYVPDEYDTLWTNESLKRYYEENKKLLEYVYKYDLENVDIFNFNSALMKTKQSVCNGGETSFSIDANGYIYPCVGVVGNPNWYLGNSLFDIDYKKIEKIKKIGSEENKSCVGCSRYNYCRGTRCKILNKILTNDYHMPSQQVCEFENINVAVSRDYLNFNNK